MNVLRMRTYITRDNEIARLAERMKSLRAANKTRAEQIIKDLTQSGVQSVSVNHVSGRRSLNVRMMRSANKRSDVDWVKVAKVLKGIPGAAALVEERAQAASVSAWLRERIESEEDVPEEFYTVYSLYEAPELGMQRI